MSGSSTDDRLGVTFWVALAVGGAVMAFGIRGVVVDAAGTRPAELLRWVVGADLVHDFLLAPLVVAVGWAVVRFVPRAWRVPVQAGLVASGVVLLVGWAAWRGYGHDTVPDNPTVQPLDSTTAILTVWGVVWIVVAIWIALRIVGARRSARAAVGTSAASVQPPAVTSRDDAGTLPRP